MSRNSLLELAVPLATKSLTIFVGSGFSKYMTDGKAPSWLELLVELTDRLEGCSNLSLRAKLFNTDLNGNIISGKVELSITAQMLEFEYRRRGHDIREVVAAILNERINPQTINPQKLKEISGFLEKHNNINFVTANYDTLISDHILKNRSRVFVEGLVIPKVNSGFNIFHIHGCISNPKTLILTISDYFRFQHKDTYLSRKLFTLLQETTVAIVGYSVNDFNLNNIFNEAQDLKTVSLRNCDIFLVSRDKVDPLFSDYYKYTYGMKVLGPFELNEFFDRLESDFIQANDLIKRLGSLEDVLNGSKRYTDEYLKLHSSFRHILLQATTLGITLNDSRMAELIKVILEKKYKFTREDNAWAQYEELADWLIELAEHIEISGTPIEADYLRIMKYSMETMSNEHKVGYSWAAYTLWNSRFGGILLGNQKMIKRFVEAKFGSDGDAHNIVSEI